MNSSIILPSHSISMIMASIFCFVLLLLLLEQACYLTKKRFLPGPKLVLPFIGNAITLVTDTANFWDRQSSLAKTSSSSLGVSANYLMGRFIIYISSPELSYKVFTNVRPDAFHIMSYPFSKGLFGEKSIMHMFGQEHKNLRRSILSIFSPKALASYTSIQQCIILQHLKKWLRDNRSRKPIPLCVLCRDMTMEVSQTVFLGPYLSEKDRRRFNIGYNHYNQGLMKLPINLPGFAYRKAKLAHLELLETLSSCVRKSKKRMLEKGEEPSCTIDFMMQENINTSNESSNPKFMGNLFFNFLFAAQDATTSALSWVITLLASHAEVVHRVRVEVAKHWNPDQGSALSSPSSITLENLKEMKFTEAVVKEVLRIRPPGAMVPHVAVEDFQLTNDYVVPKGTVVFPSVHDSCSQGFTEPDRFDPARFLEERREGDKYKRNFLVFGTGAHQCVAQKYSLHFLMLFVAIFTMVMDLEQEGGESDGNWGGGIVFAPSIFPKDDGKVIISQRLGLHYSKKLSSRLRSWRTIVHAFHHTTEINASSRSHT